MKKKPKRNDYIKIVKQKRKYNKYKSNPETRYVYNTVNPEFGVLTSIYNINNDRTI